MAADSATAHIAKEIAIPALAMVALGIWPVLNYKLGGGLMPHGLVYLAIRLVVVGAAGFMVTHRTKSGVGAAAVAGAAMFLVESLTVAVWFAIDGQLNAAIGVAKSFAMFVAVPTLVGALGGFIGRAWSKRGHAAI